MKTFYIRTELYNLLTGIFLIVAAVIDLLRADFSMALSWAIFAAMYLVMDDYSCPVVCKATTPLKKTTNLSRKIFGPLGLVFSVILVGYYIATF